MSTITIERREAERLQAKLHARWEAVLTQRTGTIADISASGCFLLTRDEVMPGELVRIEIQLPTGPWMYLWAEVVYQIPEMGFALRFTGSNKTEKKMLNRLLNILSETAPA
jgi:hypothetical protein